MGRIEKAWFDLIGKFPHLAVQKIPTKDIPRNLSYDETKAILMRRMILK